MHDGKPCKGKRGRKKSTKNGKTWPKSKPKKKARGYY